jgi:hypothetical protein
MTSTHDTKLVIETTYTLYASTDGLFNAPVDLIRKVVFD